MCSRLPSPLGSKDQDWGPTPPALGLLLLCLFTRQSLPQSPSCHIYWSPFGRLFPKLSCKSMDSSQRTQEAFLPVTVCVPRGPLPHVIIRWEPLWSSSCLLPPFFPGSDSVLFLLEPSAYICCLLFQCLSFPVNKMVAIRIINLFQSILRRLEADNTCKDLRIEPSYTSIINE